MVVNDSRRAARGPFLVTGATGFIGANLTRRLVALGEQVHVILRNQSDTWRIADLPSGVVRFHHGDLSDGPRLVEIIQEIKPRVVFHCAAYGVASADTDVSQIFDTNVLGTIKLMDALSTVEFDVFVNTGSFFEYGNQSLPATEDADPKPLSAYGAAKLASTLYCQMKARSEDYPVVTLRLFYPYGPFEGPSRLIPAVIRSCLERRELALTSGTQYRDFIFVGDVVDAYLKAAETLGLGGQVFNIGSGTGRRLREVIEHLISVLGSHTAPHWGSLPARKFDVVRCDADVTHARQVLGWSPKVSLSDGLSETAAWHESILNRL